MKILFVEDSSTLRRSLVRIANENGLTPIEAENGAEALVRLRKHGSSIDLIVMDWNMPVMDGYTALVKIRNDSEYAHIPVLMATADGAQEDVVKAIEAGATGYLVKPFSPETLMEKINGILRPNMETEKK